MALLLNNLEAHTLDMAYATNALIVVALSIKVDYSLQKTDLLRSTPQSENSTFSIIFFRRAFSPSPLEGGECLEAMVGNDRILSEYELLYFGKSCNALDRLRTSCT